VTRAGPLASHPGLNLTAVVIDLPPTYGTSAPRAYRGWASPNAASHPYIASGNKKGNPMKTEAEHFSDWESEVFGFGYGSGDDHVIRALKGFLSMCTPKNEGSQPSYDYRELEGLLSPATAWLLINILCRHGVNIIEYGSSPRFGWLTKEGRALQTFLAAHTVEELVSFIDREDRDDCTPSFCNCGPHGYAKEKICHNPFWIERP